MKCDLCTLSLDVLEEILTSFFSGLEIFWLIMSRWLSKIKTKIKELDLQSQKISDQIAKLTIMQLLFSDFINIKNTSQYNQFLL